MGILKINVLKKLNTSKDVKQLKIIEMKKLIKYFCMLVALVVVMSSCNKEIIVGEHDHTDHPIHYPSDTVYQTTIEYITQTVFEPKCLENEHLVYDHPQDTEKYALDVNSGVPFNGDPYDCVVEGGDIECTRSIAGFTIPYCEDTRLNDIKSIIVTPLVGRVMNGQIAPTQYPSEIFYEPQYDGDVIVQVEIYFTTTGIGAFLLEVETIDGMVARYWTEVEFK